MRVRHISVSGLFGMFDHEIPLQEESRITLLHGLNGIGKTTVLEMVWECLTGKPPFDVLSNVPYKSFALDFDDGSSLRVEGSDPGRPGPRLTYEDADGKEHFEPFGLVGALFLKTGRLLELRKQQRWVDEHEVEEHVVPVQVVDDRSREIAWAIEGRRSEYAGISQELDQSFPARLLDKPNGPALSASALRERLAELGRRRERLAASGILPPLVEAIKEVPAETDAVTLKALTIYVHDTEKKLAVFGGLAERIDALVEILGRRLRRKRLEVRREKGFCVTLDNGEAVPLSRLSSGEQHQLIVFYDLLFRTKPDTLVLIDEPEISLHLLWQQEFLNDLERIVKLTGIDVLLATHSADIIDRHWDWTVALKETSA